MAISWGTGSPRGGELSDVVGSEQERTEGRGYALHPAWVGGEPGTLPSDCSRDSKMLIFVATLKP